MPNRKEVTQVISRLKKQQIIKLSEDPSDNEEFDIDTLIAQKEKVIGLSELLVVYTQHTQANFSQDKQDESQVAKSYE